MKSEEMYLRSILDSIVLVEQYVSVGYKEFIDSTHWQDAVERRLINIGEAVKHLEEVSRKRHPEIDWQKIAGMRDVLTHDYFNVDPEIVWVSATQRLKGLKAAIEDILAWF